ncbi:MAG: GNAT family N-acetyltransferase [Cyanobacteria bacterium P01_G01_bin.54]
MKLRSVNREGHALVRELRIAALRDAPGSFAESADEASARPISYWIEQTQSLVDPHIMFLVEVDGKPRGTIYGLVDQQYKASSRVGGLWVDSAYRGQGLGHLLLNAVLQWTRSKNFGAIRLWVPIEVPAAKALYLKAGFEFTNKVKRVECETPLDIREMQLLF